LNIAVVCIVAAALICAATIYLLVHSLWPALAPIRARWRQPIPLGGAARLAVARKFLARPIAEMPPLAPPPTGNDPGASAHGKVERGVERQTAGKRYNR
jgi:hypothetical protein